MCPKESNPVVLEETATESLPGEGSEPANLRPPINPIWSRATDYFIHYLVPEAVTFVALLATRRPRTTICSIAFFSLALAVIGYYTNFELDVSEFTAYAPYGIRARAHSDWIQDDSGFPPDDRLFVQLIHADGANVVSMEGIRKAFEAYHAVYDLKEYKEFCTLTNKQLKNNLVSDECPVSSPLRYWNYNQTLFEETVQSDEDVIATLQQDTYPDGTPAERRLFLGNYEMKTQTDGTRVLTAQSFLTVFQLPYLEPTTAAFEEVGMEALFPIRDQWTSEGDDHPFRLDFITSVAYSLEFERAINEDYKLVPVVFFIMAAFTCSTFYRRDPVESRMLLGLGAVVTIVCSLMAGYGFLFICGVPLNNLSTLVPFVVFGVGLDDTFIITGAFARTNRSHPIEERIRKTMKDVGVSITVTTLSTFMALALGALSQVPAVSWLCKYAMTTIFVDFVWQISLFVALLVLDEERIQAKRRGCCVCFKATPSEASEAEQEQEQHSNENQFSKPSFVDRLMVWYSDRLLHPAMKIVVLISFTALFAACAYSASKLTQEFRITELLPSDSYVLDFMEASESYTPRFLPVMAYFRFVNQSDVDVQKQMGRYVDELGNLTYFAEPQFCWVKDVQALLNDDSLAQSALGLALQNRTFNEQLRLLLTVPAVKEVYGKHIILDEDGNIESSRCQLFIDNLDFDDIDDQLGMLHAQKHVSESQPINQDRDNWAFFNYDNLYLTFEFYDIVEREFMFTGLVGVVAVTVIGFLCIPHWSATLFVLPMMGVLYVDLVGIIQAAGLSINIVTHVTLAMAVGLLVDYLVHVLLRFYETSKYPTREEKVKDTLRTIGAAVLSGGLSTLLGVLPLIFASSAVTRTVFISFLAMVTLGVGHGLIFLPVVLSMMGPESTPVLGQRNEVKVSEDPKTTKEEEGKVETEETHQVLIGTTGSGTAEVKVLDVDA